MHVNRHTPTQLQKLSHVKTPWQQGNRQQCCSKYSGHWWVPCSVWFPEWNKQPLIYAAARHSSQTHSQSMCHMHHSKRQYSSCQSDKAPTYSSNSEGSKLMAVSVEGWGEMVFRQEGERGDSQRMGGYVYTFILGVGSDREVAVHTEMRFCKKVWQFINHQSARVAKIYRDLEWEKNNKQAIGQLEIHLHLYMYVMGTSIKRTMLRNSVVIITRALTELYDGYVYKITLLHTQKWPEIYFPNLNLLYTLNYFTFQIFVFQA